MQCSQYFRDEPSENVEIQRRVLEDKSKMFKKYHEEIKSHADKN